MAQVTSLSPMAVYMAKRPAFVAKAEAVGLDLFNPQLKSLKQEYQLKSEKQEGQLKSLKQEGQIKWLQ